MKFDTFRSFLAKFLLRLYSYATYTHETRRHLQRIHLLRTRLNKGYMSQRRGCGGCLRRSIALCYSLRGKEGRGREARPAVGHLLGRMEPVAQPASARCVRR